MKKTEKKKLVLAKETVRGLSEATLMEAGGASREDFFSCRICWETESCQPAC